MLIDHGGMILFPEIELFRLIGRLAMPIFAFFIGEGCLYTKNKKAYFLRVFVLGIICQAVYAAETLISGGDGFYLNILLTFSCSIGLCSLFQYLQKRWKQENAAPLILSAIVLGAGLAEKALGLLSGRLLGSEIVFDYGFAGMCLPVFILMGKSKKEKLLSFSVGLALLCCVCYGDRLPWALCALMTIPLMYAYNGKGGRKNLKYFFYAFYPLHLAAVYLADMLIK